MKFAVVLFVAAVCLWSQVDATCEHEGRTYATGEKWDKNCVQYTCDANGGWGGLTCPLAQCPENKKTVVTRPLDESKSYPECCEQIDCV